HEVGLDLERLAVLLADEAAEPVVAVGLDRRGGKLADAAFLLARGGAVLDRPERPAQPLVLLLRRLRKDLELGDRSRALAVGGADAVGPGVAAADDDDMLALGIDHVAGERQVGVAAVLLGQI